MKLKRYELTNTADGWHCHVVRVDREQDGVMIRTWSSDGRQLEPILDGEYPVLVLPGTDTSFVMPDDDD